MRGMCAHCHSLLTPLVPQSVGLAFLRRIGRRCGVSGRWGAIEPGASDLLAPRRSKGVCSFGVGGRLGPGELRAWQASQQVVRKLA